MNAKSVPGDLALDHEPAAVAEDDRGRHRGEQVDEREVQPVEDDGLLVRRVVLRVDLAEARWLVRSRVNACTTRIPAMSSASVAVTRPSRSRTAR